MANEYRFFSGGVEVFAAPETDLLVYSAGVEVFASPTTRPLIYSAGVEVWRSINDYTPPPGSTRRWPMVQSF